MSALQLLKNRPYANSGTKISVRKEGFLASFKHDPVEQLRQFATCRLKEDDLEDTYRERPS